MKVEVNNCGKHDVVLGDIIYIKHVKSYYILNEQQSNEYNLQSIEGYGFYGHPFEDKDEFLARIESMVENDKAIHYSQEVYKIKLEKIK